MIERAELQHKAKELEVGPINVQRDYVFGWLLFAIYSATSLREILILKGGNCLRKAYFEFTRFSSDLDFSTEQEIKPEFLRDQLNNACELVQGVAGIQFDVDRSRVDEGWSADKDQHVYKARLYFHDFFGNREEVLISVRLDITEFDKIYLPTQNRNLIHSYSDRDECITSVRCVALEEALAAKLKCLLQRKHIADLFDFVFAVLINQDLDIDRGQVVSVFLKKTIFGSSPRAAANILAGLPLEKLEDAWTKYIICPRQSILKFGESVSGFRSLVGEMFTGHQGNGHELAFFPSHIRNPIMEAGSNLTLLKVVYDGTPRFVEPYSLVFKRRKDGIAREYLYVYDRSGGRSSGPGIKSFVSANLNSIENTDEKFEPREEVMISKAGEPGDKLYFGNQSPFYKNPAKSLRSTTKRRSRVGGWSFVVLCPVCHREFVRQTRSTVLRPHKDRSGNRCFGRRGSIIRQELR